MVIFLFLYYDLIAFYIPFWKSQDISVETLETQSIINFSKAIEKVVVFLPTNETVLTVSQL